MAFLFPPPPPPPGLPLAGGGPSPHLSATPSFIPSRRRRSPAFSIPNPFDPKKRTVYLREVEVIGRKEVPQHVIDKYFEPILNQRIVMQKVHDAVAKINAWMQENEYLCSQVVLAKLPALNGQLVLFCIEPRLSALRLIPVDKEGKTDPNGSISTREKTISNAIGMQIGDVFVWRASGFARLMALGLFEYANAEVKVLSNDQVELILRLRERPSGRIEPGAGVASDGRVYGDISIVDNNFMGRAQRLRLEWQKRLDVDRSAGGIAFEDQRIGARIPLSFRMRAYRDCNVARGIPAGSVTRSSSGGTNEREGAAAANTMQPDTPLRYEKDRDGLLFDVGYRPTGSYTLFNFTPMLEHVHPNPAEASGISCVQAVLQTGFTHATRLPVELPRAGHIFRIEQFLGTPLSTAVDPFYKIALRLTRYAPFGNRASVATGVVAGIGTDNLPWHEQKSLGGQMSVRGFEYGELGRYKAFGTARVELRVPLAFNKSVGDEEPAPLPTAGASAPGADGAAVSKGSALPGAGGPGGTAGGAGATGSAKAAGGAKAAGSAKTEGSAKVDGNDGDTSAEGTEEDNMIPNGGFLDRLPPLVGVVFGDIASADTGRPGRPEIIGSSYGLGLRIGGVIAVEWTGTSDGRSSHLHFGLVDHGF